MCIHGVHACGGEELTSIVFLPASPPYLLSQGFSLERRACQFSSSSYPACSGVLLPLSSLHRDCKLLSLPPCSYVGTGDLSTCPQVSGSAPRIGFPSGLPFLLGHLVVSWKKVLVFVKNRLDQDALCQSPMTLLKVFRFLL